MKEGSKRELIKRLQKPEGKFIFSERYNWGFKNGENVQNLENIHSGQVVVNLERTENFDINFVHSCHGTGTRIATVNIESMKESSYLTYFLFWSPESISLSVKDDKQTLVESKGCKQADYILMTSPQGWNAKFGAKGVEVMNPVLIVSDKKNTTIIESPAIKSWRDTLKAVSILQTGESKEGYIFENVISCLSLTMLCTGFEVYCRRRFFELIAEGYDFNNSEVETKFVPKNQCEVYSRNAKENRRSLVQELVARRRIDFGNYDNCKDAFSKGFGINLTKDLGVPIQTIQRICEFIEYRHKLIHVSPWQNTFNYYEPEKKTCTRKQSHY